ncbi:Tat pathway signal protein [Vibrio coralliilyticus]
MTAYTVSFCGTGCTRDEGEVTREWKSKIWQFWKDDFYTKSDMQIYNPKTGYIPVRLHKEISGNLNNSEASASVRGVGENDWANQVDTSDVLLTKPKNGLLTPPKELLDYVASYVSGNQRTTTGQIAGWSAAALALHGACLAADSKAKTLNFIGHSRGAMEAIMAAWFIYAYGDESIKNTEINIFAIDPVPGTGEWYGILTQLPPNVKNYVGVYAWDHLDTGFSALVPRPNNSMTGEQKELLLGSTWQTLADNWQLKDPLTPGEATSLANYKLYACRGRHSTVAGNITTDGGYGFDKVEKNEQYIKPQVPAVSELVYRLARGYLTQWGTVFIEASKVETSVQQLRQSIHTNHRFFDLMGGGEARTSNIPTRQKVRRVSSIHGRSPVQKYYIDDVAGDPPYELAYPVTYERKEPGWVSWDFL